MAGLANTGRGDGAPGIRAQYDAHYYAPFLRDPDGNKIDLVLRGRLKQMRIRHLPAVAVNSNAPRPAEYHWLFWASFWFGFLAFSALLAIFQSE
jgi:hypothetical protein